MHIYVTFLKRKKQKHWKNLFFVKKKKKKTIQNQRIVAQWEDAPTLLISNKSHFGQDACKSREDQPYKQ